MSKRKASTSELVSDAIKEGVLIRPDRCEDCDAAGTVLGHHDDYAEPLIVRWLCPKCHGRWHRHNHALNKYLRDSYTKDATDFVPYEDGACEICGHPLQHTSGKVKKKYHKPCRDFRNFLAATVRAVKQMDPKPTDEASKEIRHQVFVAQCRICALVQPRDELGRFR